MKNLFESIPAMECVTCPNCPNKYFNLDKKNVSHKWLHDDVSSRLDSGSLFDTMVLKDGDWTVIVCPACGVKIKVEFILNPMWYVSIES